MYVNAIHVPDGVTYHEAVPSSQSSQTMSQPCDSPHMCNGFVTPGRYTDNKS